MKKPTEENVGKCCDMIKAHFRQYGNAATESRLAALVHSINSVLHDAGKPAADHIETVDNDRALAAKAAEVSAAKAAAKPAPEPEKKAPEFKSKQEPAKKGPGAAAKE
jgi:hypothetical protein